MIPMRNTMAAAPIAARSAVPAPAEKAPEQREQLRRRRL